MIDSTRTIEELKKAQAQNLWWTGHRVLESEADAVRFMKTLKLALRYNATPSLPLAAIHKAAGDSRRSVEVQNALLASGEAIETNLIADRLVFVHRTIAPALYALRRRKDRALNLSSNAERAFSLIQTDGHASSGDVRRYLGVYGMTRPDPGDAALTELQREFLIDRGPASIPKKGVPYLAPEGYPYRVFERAHPDVIRSAKKLTVEKAAVILMEAFLEPAGYATHRKIQSMFRLLLTQSEIESIDSDSIERTKTFMFWSRSRS